MKLKLKLFYRVELFATGYYRGLAKQYGKRYPDRAKRLIEFANNEYGHGKLFNECYYKSYGKEIGGEGFWVGFGKVQAYFLFLLPLIWKIKVLSAIERLAVVRIEKEIASGELNSFIDVLKQILPDEKKHALLYREWYR